MTIIEIVQQFKSLDVNSISMKSKHFKVPLEYIYYSESSDGVHVCPKNTLLFIWGQPT